MTLRERIADWISGGFVSHYNRRMEAHEATIERLNKANWDMCLALLKVIERGNTKAPNSTVRDMVRIAQEGLER